MSIETAKGELHTARNRAVRRSRGRSSIAGARVELDQLIDQVELVSVGREPFRQSEFMRRLRGVARSLSSPPPPAIRRARTPAQLHAALMDWQDGILDRAAPQRLAYPDRRE